MLAADIGGVLLIFGVLLLGLFAARKVQLKLATNREKLITQGKRNTAQLAVQLELTCCVCGQPTAAEADLWLKDRWWHLPCWDEATKKQAADVAFDDSKETESETDR